MTLSIKSQRFGFGYSVHYPEQNKSIMGTLAPNAHLDIEHGKKAVVDITINEGDFCPDEDMEVTEPLLIVQSCNDLPINIFLVNIADAEHRTAYCSGDDENCIAVMFYKARQYAKVRIKIG